MGKVLGKGKFSTVRKAIAPNGDLVAVKRLEIYDIVNADERKAYLNEVGLMQNLVHPNIVKFLDWFLDENILYIVMELAEIGDLARVIRKAREKSHPIAEKTIWKLFFQVCQGLKHMHDQRIMHRDLKPANIFVSGGGLVKLGDLGLGRMFGTETTKADSLVGTPYYMSPERVGQEAYNLASDVWSLGCILYEMAALQNPFYRPGLDLISLVDLITRCDYPPLPPTCSDRLRDLVASILVVDPTQRPSVREICAVAKERVQWYKDHDVEDSPR